MVSRADTRIDKAEASRAQRLGAKNAAIWRNKLKLLHFGQRRYFLKLTQEQFALGNKLGGIFANKRQRIVFATLGRCA